MNSGRAPQSLWQALKVGTWGILRAMRSETNMSRHFWLFNILAVVEWVLRPALPVAAATLFVSACVFAAELMNTAIEHTVDLVVGATRHRLAGFAKDAAAGAVTAVSFGAVCIAAWVLVSTWPWHFYLFTRVHLGGAILTSAFWVVLWSVYIRSRQIEIEEPTEEEKDGL